MNELQTAETKDGDPQMPLHNNPSAPVQPSPFRAGAARLNELLSRRTVKVGLPIGWIVGGVVMVQLTGHWPWYVAGVVGAIVAVLNSVWSGPSDRTDQTAEAIPSGDPS